MKASLSEPESRDRLVLFHIKRGCLKFARHPLHNVMDTVRSFYLITFSSLPTLINAVIALSRCSLS